MAEGLTILLTIPLLLFMQLFCIFLHELAHAATAGLCGWTTIMVKTGSGTISRSFMLRNIEFRFTPLPFSGLAQSYGTESMFFRTKGFLFAVSGPLVTAALVVLLWWMYAVTYNAAQVWISATFFWLIIFQLPLLAGSLIPHMAKIDGQSLPNDSLLAWRYLTMKQEDVAGKILENVLGAVHTYLQRGQTEKAASVLQHAATQEVNTNVMSVKVLWLHLLLLSGKTKEANRIKTDLLANSDSVDSTHVQILDSLACLPIFYGHSELLDESLEFIALAIRVAPDNITLMGTKAALLIELGRVDEGLQLVEKVDECTKSENDRAIVSYYRALAHAKTGDTKRAQKLLHYALKKYPQCIVRNRVAKLVCEAPLKARASRHSDATAS